MITAAGRMLMTLGRGILRQTKHLSPYKSTTVTKDIIKKKGNKKLKSIGTGFTGIKNSAAGTIKTKQEFTPIARYANRGLKKIGVSATNRAKTIAGYNTGYKHVRRNKKRYASAVAGAAAWDMMSDDS